MVNKGTPPSPPEGGGIKRLCDDGGEGRREQMAEGLRDKGVLRPHLAGSKLETTYNILNEFKINNYI